MIFSSITFIGAFLPATLVIYLLLPGIRAKNILLIVSSLVFYSLEPVGVFVMLGCVLWNYVFALLMPEVIRNGKRRILLFLCVAADLIVLGLFKYSGLLPHLPAGISFFIFQAVSYAVDVYKEKIPAEKNITDLLLYIAFFPQLIAGPIVRYGDISREIKGRNRRSGDISSGIRRFIAGLSKKVLIADNLAVTADYVFGAGDPSLSLPLAWIGAVAYALQIYFDFSGYSDMAVGLGRMFGFYLPENFDHPYAAGSLLDFWRRWHITLTGWFREYLYIPLGGNRKGSFREFINRMIVFICVGVWHGAGLTFLIWGAYHGILTAVEAALPEKKKGFWVTGVFFTFILVVTGFVIFRSETAAQALLMIKHMYLPVQLNTERTAALYESFNRVSLIAAFAGCIIAAPLYGALRDALIRHGKLKGNWHKLTYAVSMPLLILCLMSLAGKGYHPFIYYRF